MFYLIFFVFSTFAGFGLNAKLVPRIGGGEISNIDDFPYQVSLRAQGQHICGGAIISALHILTAGHCVINDQGNLMSIAVHSGGTLYKRIVDDSKKHLVERIWPHPKYNRKTLENDIAVIRLQQQIVFSAVRRPIDLPTRPPRQGASAHLAGWGTDYNNKGASEYLHMINARIVTSANCIFLGRRVLPTQVCSLTSLGTGVCKGDSGGPLVSNGQIVGLVSYGQIPCTLDEPDIYTNVYPYVPWISGKMSLNSNQRRSYRRDFPIGQRLTF